MREILFRGKSIKTGEWVEGWFVPGNERKSLNPSIFVYLPETQSFDCIDVDIETVEQYTGLKDKNGTRIFEGDIVKDITESYDRCWGDGRKRSGIAVVKYGYHGVRSEDPFCYGLAYGVYFDGDTVLETPAQYFGYDKYQTDERYQFEVIGNIYDNPELLESKV